MKLPVSIDSFSAAWFFFFSNISFPEASASIRDTLLSDRVARTHPVVHYGSLKGHIKDLLDVSSTYKQTSQCFILLFLVFKDVLSCSFLEPTETQQKDANFTVMLILFLSVLNNMRGKSLRCHKEKKN